MTSRGPVFVSKEYLRSMPVTERNLLNLASWEASSEISAINRIRFKSDNLTVNSLL